MSSALLRGSFRRLSSSYKSFNGSAYWLLSRSNSSASTKTRDDKIKKFTVEDEQEVIFRLKQSFQEDEEVGDIVPIFKKALLYGNKIAVKDPVGEYSYAKLYTAAKKLALQISNFCGSGSGSNIAFLCPNDALYPIAQWACWFSGQVAVPLSSRHPKELLRYFIEDSKSNVIITSPEYEPVLKPIAEKLEKILMIIDHDFIPNIDGQTTSILDPKNENVLLTNDRLIIEGALNSTFYTNANAMILYTSGTTGNPKGVLLSHKNVHSQVNCLTDAWEFSDKDCLLHVLPLNHVHGCVNALMCPLSVGAKLIMQDHFDSHNVWSALLGINTPAKDRVNLFMAVPTIYNFLIDEYDKIFAKNSRMVEYIENHCKKNIRLMVSGSAPLPTTVFNRWFEISGHRLLERYGMTEIGMALSNPYHEDKVRQRRSGTVGLPLPGVEVRIMDSDGKKCLFYCKGESKKGFWSKESQPVYESKTASGAGAAQKSQPNEDSSIGSSAKPSAIVGHLHVKGPSVFKKYYNREKETEMEFDGDYFKTGDTIAYENGLFKILGRTSLDIIKSGGYKISALEIETHLLNHPNIKDVAVVGVEDLTWGQKVAAVVVLRNETELDLESLKIFCSERLSKYSIPSLLKIVNELPRNAMGKVNKKDILKLYFTTSENKIVPPTQSEMITPNKETQQREISTTTRSGEIKKTNNKSNPTESASEKLKVTSSGAEDSKK